MNTKKVAFLDLFVLAVYQTLIAHYNVEITEATGHGKTDSEIDDMIASNRLYSRETTLEKLARKRK